jgi:hypothetical protein
VRGGVVLDQGRAVHIFGRDTQKGQWVGNGEAQPLFNSFHPVQLTCRATCCPLSNGTRPLRTRPR